MTLIEKVENALNNKQIKLNGALYLSVNENDTVAKVYDMNYTTFSKRPIGVYFVAADKLTTY